MVTVRRGYIYLACAISLQSVTWAIISLLRDWLTLGGQAPVTSMAFQISVILIGLPIFLAHWLWAQRLARQDSGERESALRRLYLYGTLAGCLGLFMVNAFDLAALALSLAFRGNVYEFYSPASALIRHLVAMICLASLWLYHQRLVAADARVVSETGHAATVRRLYIFSFSAVGVTMVTLALIDLLRWAMFQFEGRAGLSAPNMIGLTEELARLLVGLPVWLAFWNWAQRLFVGPSAEERESALRKFYLYVTVFIAVLAAITQTTFILAEIFRNLLNLPAITDIRLSLAIVGGMAGLWAYHAYILREDAAQAVEASQAAGIRRLYLYLVAAVGVAACWLGLGGDISVLIRWLSQRAMSEALKDQLASFTAALIVGGPVWLLSWRRIQVRGGTEARRSVVRKLYLYFYLLAATLTVLSSAVYIVYRSLSLLLGERSGGNLLSDLGQAIAFTLIGVGVWLYHGSILRGDGRINHQEQAGRLAEVHVAVVDVGEGRFGRGVLDGLRRAMPGLAPDFIMLSSPAYEAARLSEAVLAQLSRAGLIVAPWMVAVVAGKGGGVVTAEAALAVIASPARKLMIPIQTDGWEWAGLDRWNAEALVQQTVRAVKQWVEGDEVKAIRPMSVGAIIGIAVGVLLLFGLMVVALLNLVAIPVLLSLALSA